MNIENVKLVNLTPHTVHVEGIGSIPSTGGARVATTEENIGTINGVPFFKTIFGKVEGLPEPQEGTIYIVSAFVIQMLAGTRQDVIAPDTGKYAIRDQDGKIIGTKKFTTY